jgi:hypothetical protein
MDRKLKLYIITLSRQCLIMFALYTQKIAALNSRARQVSAGITLSTFTKNKTELGLFEELPPVRLLPQLLKSVAFIFSENVISKCPSRNTKNESVPGYLCKP